MLIGQTRKHQELVILPQIRGQLTDLLTEIQQQLKEFGLHCSIKQWGSGVKNGSITVLPISFLVTNWIAAGMKTSANYDYSFSIVDKTTNSFTAGSWGGPFDYIALGW